MIGGFTEHMNGVAITVDMWPVDDPPSWFNFSHSPVVIAFHAIR